MLKEGARAIDFIETYGRRSNNTYEYLGSFSKNIQTKVRVFAPKSNKDLPFTIKITGKNLETDSPAPISTLQIPPIVFNGHKFYDIAFLTTKSRHSGYKLINFELIIEKVEDVAIFVEIGVSDVAVSDIFIYDHVYFSSS